MDDNIPLRVMLLLMDEVFDLKEKNQWLRRNIKNLLQQLIRATYGDTINRSGRSPHTHTHTLSGYLLVIFYSVPQLLQLSINILTLMFQYEGDGGLQSPEIVTLFTGKLWTTWTT